MQAFASVTGVPPIPAMTTDAERECYYRLAKAAAGKGEIIELGAWLGASTAYIASGIRDSGVDAVVHVYDKFKSKQVHAAKVAHFYDKAGLDPIPVGPARHAFEAYLGPLLARVEVHEGMIEKTVSSDGPIALLITDAPKRVPEISAVLTALHRHIVPQTIMAWQDFGHFPSYDIPACLYRIRRHFEVVESINPGTTLVFRVKSSWSAAEVSRAALTPKRWTATEIETAWAYWLPHIPEGKRWLFTCGRALFLCDIGQPLKAVEVLVAALEADAASILPKWKYLRNGRPDLVRRYLPLFDHLAEGRLL